MTDDTALAPWACLKTTCYPEFGMPDNHSSMHGGNYLG